MTDPDIASPYWDRPRFDAVNEGLLADELERFKKDSMFAGYSTLPENLVERIVAALRAVPSPDTVGVREASFTKRAVELITEAAGHRDDWGKYEYAIIDLVREAALSPSHCTAGRREVDPLIGLAERLDRLLLTASDNSRFVLSTESAKNIVEIVREWLRCAALTAEQSGPIAEPK